MTLNHFGLLLRTCCACVFWRAENHFGAEGTKFCLARGFSENETANVLAQIFAEHEVGVMTLCWIAGVSSYSKVAGKLARGEAQHLLHLGFEDVTAETMWILEEVFASMKIKLVGWTQRLSHLGSGCLSARGIVEINVYYVWCSIICNVNCGEHFKWTWSLVTFWPKWRERWEPTYLMLALTHQPPRAPPMHSSSPPQPRRLGAETNLLGKWLLVSERHWGNKIAFFFFKHICTPRYKFLFVHGINDMYVTCNTVLHSHTFSCIRLQILINIVDAPGWACFWWRWRCHNQKC